MPNQLSGSGVEPVTCNKVFTQFPVAFGENSNSSPKLINARTPSVHTCDGLRRPSVADGQVVTDQPLVVPDGVTTTESANSSFRENKACVPQQLPSSTVGAIKNYAPGFVRVGNPSPSIVTSNSAITPLVGNASTPTLVRVGSRAHALQSAGALKFGTNVGVQRSLHSIQYQPEDVNTSARRIRVSLINQHSKIINPSLKRFSNETDVVSCLVPYHLFEAGSSPPPRYLENDNAEYHKSSRSIALRTNAVLRKLNRLNFSSKSRDRVFCDLTLTKLFNKYEQDRQQAEFHVQKSVPSVNCQLQVQSEAAFFRNGSEGTLNPKPG